MREEANDLVFVLEPKRFKSAADEELKTVLGKRNRIAIGQPRCTMVKSAALGGLSPADKLAYPLKEHRFYRIAFDLTLVPDEGCRFRSVDLVFVLQPDPVRKKLPIVLRLKPEKLETKAAIKVKSGTAAKLKVGEPVLKSLGAEVGESSSVETKFEKVEASLASFGAGTREAGWRFNVTENREIPLSVLGLELLIALSPESPGKAKFRLAATIDVRSPMDRWLSNVFSRDKPLSTDYGFPEE